MNFSQAMVYLETLQKEDTLEREWDLQGIEELFRKLNNPEKSLGTIIHVTGTNGKGSVCAMSANILKEAGYKVGLYTSPHLKRITERIQINNKEISQEDFAATLHRIQPFITTQSFFEVMTALAFLHFAEQEVDFCILEVGIGGRLDATNVVQSTISVITNISLEHTQRLGKTVQEIAEEKVGIIKEGIICVTAAQGEALAVIQKICTQKNATMLIAKPTDAYTLSLPGKMQKENAGIVVTIIEALKKRDVFIPKIHIVEGLQTTRWPGRLEFIEKNVLVDVAHNPGGMQQLAQEIKKIKQGKGKTNLQRIIFVIGILADKEWKLMLDQIVPVGDLFILTKPENPRALEPVLLQRYLEKEYGLEAGREAFVIENIPAALEKAKQFVKETEKEALIVITGSFYIVGPLYPDHLSF